MRPMRVAVWGLGQHAINRILPAVAAVRGIKLYGVCSRDARSVSTCAERWKCNGWTDAASMLRDADADIIYLATPSGLHAGHGKRILQARKHFWCEKPLACELQDTLALLESSRRERLSICEGFMYLHHPQFLRLSGYLAAGRFGPIISIGCRFGIPTLKHPGFRSDPALGGGALFDVGCYPISAVQALFPAEKPEVSYASIVTRDGSAVDTGGRAVIALAAGAVANLEWGIDCAYRNEIDIWAQRGSVFSDRIFSKPADHIPVFRVRDAEGVESIEYGEAKDHFVSMLENFLGTIHDLHAAEGERDRIARRAGVLDRIRTASGSR